MGISARHRKDMRISKSVRKIVGSTTRKIMIRAEIMIGGMESTLIATEIFFFIFLHPISSRMIVLYCKRKQTTRACSKGYISITTSARQFYELVLVFSTKIYNAWFCMISFVFETQDLSIVRN
jgi:hypothetical protein